MWYWVSLWKLESEIHTGTSFFFGYPRHMEVPRPGIKSELQLWPMLQLQQHQSLTYCAGLGIEPMPLQQPESLQRQYGSGCTTGGTHRKTFILSKLKKKIVDRKELCLWLPEILFSFIFRANHRFFFSFHLERTKSQLSPIDPYLVSGSHPLWIIGICVLSKFQPFSWETGEPVSEIHGSKNTFLILWGM